MKRIRIEQKAWGILYSQPGETPVLLHQHWLDVKTGRYPGSLHDASIAVNVIKYRTHALAGAFCNTYRGWAFRPVRIREVVEVEL